ncbi:MAG: dihydroxy-acid dehydratase [Gaiellales bacterium]
MSGFGSGALGSRLTSYGDPEFSRYLRGAFLAAAGFDAVDLERPVVGIADTSSDYTPCHRGMPELIGAVARGVLEAGGLPLRFPTMSLGEPLVSPTTMLYRNLLAIETEELLLAQPMDAAVLVGGCDKTLPAQLMGALSANASAVFVAAGPMTTGSWRGARLGACTDCREYWQQFRAGRLSEGAIAEIQGELCPTEGTCMVMGTASTMACAYEALGVMLPGGASAPAPTSARLRSAVQSGRLAVDLAVSGRRLGDVVDSRSFHNAVVCLLAIGGSTNAVIHLIAAARRAGVELGLAEIDVLSRSVPVLLDLKPSGSGYMEDFHRAGGVPALLTELAPLLELDALTVTGEPLGEWLRDVEPRAEPQSVIRRLTDPFHPPGGLRVLRGSLAPDGAVIKCAAATRRLLHHTGPAIVIDNPDELGRLDDPDLKVTAESVLVLRNAGPVAAGMPEAGYLPIPRKLAAVGVKDMVRISDARMSGTAFGTVVLHCAPEAAVGGPLALVADGDLIALDAEAGTLDLLVPEDERARRAAALRLPAPPNRGWRSLHARHVLQADKGADLGFLGPGGR